MLCMKTGFAYVAQRRPFARVGIYRKCDFAGGLSSIRGNIRRPTGVCSGGERRHYSHWSTLAIFLFAPMLRLQPTVKENSRPMKVNVVSVEHEAFGSVVRFEIRNTGIPLSERSAQGVSPAEIFFWDPSLKWRRLCAQHEVRAQTAG